MGGDCVDGDLQKALNSGRIGKLLEDLTKSF